MAKTIENLNSGKAHVHDMISISAFKLFDELVLKSLEVLIGKSCIESGKFPIDFSKTNVVPLHKKVTNRYKKLSPNIVNCVNCLNCIFAVKYSKD